MSKPEIAWNDTTKPRYRVGRRSDGAIFIHVGSHYLGADRGLKAAAHAEVDVVSVGSDRYVPLTWVNSEANECIAAQSKKHIASKKPKTPAGISRGFQPPQIY